MEVVWGERMEQKYESDLTRKEKVQLELDKIKSMKISDRIEYLWTYYKLWLLAILGIILAVYIGSSMWREATKEELLSIAVIGGDSMEQERVEELRMQLLTFIGSGSKKEKLSLDVAFPLGDDPTAVMKQTVVIGSGTLDLMICDADTYERYEEQEAFLEWKDVLGADYSTYETFIEDGKMVLSKSQRWNQYEAVPYNPVYVGVLNSTDKEENIKKMLEFFYQ